ncbi:MAG: hypothetical protein DMF80_10085 [Acidobacteria bacterium]|nr:MAG: hypothetical protein DMF80_10085 [Acidobacteriota bacterium]
MAELTLDAGAVSKTIELLSRRVDERFPGSGLSGIGRQLERIAGQARARAAAIARPIAGVRVTVALLILLIAAGLAGTVGSLRRPREPIEAFQFVQVLESGINDVVLVGAGIFFLLTLETRIKRRRALAAMRELRAIAHIIDMHQLTKDPEWVLRPGRESALLPPRRLTRFELSRYLDYCSEMLSITGKIAALYIQDFDDGVALAAVNEVEELTTGLSRKIWQKLMILYAMGPEETEGAEAARR